MRGVAQNHPAGIQFDEGACLLAFWTVQEMVSRCAGDLVHHKARIQCWQLVAGITGIPLQPRSERLLPPPSYQDARFSWYLNNAVILVHQCENCVILHAKSKNLVGLKSTAYPGKLGWVLVPYQSPGEVATLFKSAAVYLLF